MDLERRCTILKVQLASDLLKAADTVRCEQVLIEALYEVSRTILPALGYPKKSEEYLEKLHLALEVISFIGLNLVKCARGSRGVAVLAEVGEGCRDPLLRRKLSGYAQELLANVEASPRETPGWQKAPVAAVCTVIVLFTAYLGWSLQDSWQPARAPAGKAPSQMAPASQPPARQGPPAVLPAATASGTPAERAGNETTAAERQPVEVKSLGTQGEQVTRVRIIDDQVLVPVTLRNGGETVRVELVMDTGATRTAIHDYLAARLRIDPCSTRPSLAEVADGRTISSKVARIDALAAGPFTLSSTDVELIPYRKGEGGHDGLLGMDFLGRHRFQVDIENELIRWY